MEHSAEIPEEHPFKRSTLIYTKTKYHPLLVDAPGLFGCIDPFARTENVITGEFRFALRKPSHIGWESR